MGNDIKNSVMSKNGLRAIIGFCALQLVFIVMEFTGWIPNVKDFEGKFLDNMSQILKLDMWATFYDTAFFNIVTVFTGIILIAGLLYQLVRRLFRSA